MAVDVSGYDACWTFSSSSGICHEAGPWNANGALPSPHNYAFLQARGTVEQAFTVTNPGVHTIRFHAQVRAWVNGTQSMEIAVDGVPLGIVDTSTGLSLYAWRAQSFTASLAAGAHTLRFAGLAKADETMLLDSVSITGPSNDPVPLPNGDFDSYSLADGRYVLNPPAVSVASYRLVASVTTCGKLLHCRLTKISDGSTVAPGTINEAPVLYLNGVNKGAIQASGMLTTAAHASWLVPLPSGVIAAVNAAVTLSASEGWIFGPAGYAEGMAGQPASNYVGRSFVRTTDAPRTTKIGGGAFSHFVTPEWRNGVATKNQRYRIPYWNPGVTTDPGGNPLSMSATTCRAPIFSVAAPNNIDATYYPTPEGYYAVRWDDLDGLTTFALDDGGSGGAAVTEVTSINNPGSGGLGKVRVFDFRKSGTAANFPVYVALTTGNADKSVHFDNLEIRMPGDFSWTAGQPTTIPVSNFYDLPKVITDRIPPSLTGWSGFRYNDALTNWLGSSAACQRNHLVEPGDFHWAQDVKVHYTARFTQARPWDPGVTPYVYDPLSGSPYAATLGAAITTAPAAGTVETITVPDAATAPVLAGLELTIGDERMVVRSVSGAAVVVLRGAASTTPTAHAAGEISVSGRRPLTIAGAGLINKQIVELVTQGPHRLKTGQVPAAFAGNWPAFVFTDGRQLVSWIGTFAGYAFECWVTGADTYLVMVDGPTAGAANVTLGGTYGLDGTCQLDPGGCYLPEYGGCPHELASAVAAQYPGCAGWASIPPVASDDMVDEIARRHFAYLPADRDLWIELGDENWNFGSRQAKYWQGMDYQVFGLVGTNGYWNAYRSCQVRDRFRAIAASLGRDPGRVKTFLNTQPGASGNLPSILSFLASHGMSPDGFAFGPYYNFYYVPALFKAWAAWPTDMLVDAWIWDFYFNTSGGGGNAWSGGQSTLAGGFRSQLDAWNAAHGTNIELLIYEYAPEIVFPAYSTGLGAAMDGTQTTLTLAAGVAAQPLDNAYDDAAKICPGTWLLCGSEWMTVVSRSGTTVTVNRGQGGTTAAAHAAGAALRNDWLEGTRDITLHPNYRIAHHDVLAFFQSYGVSLLMPSALDQDWSGGHAWSDYHAIAQLPGKGDGSDGKANNLACLARPGQANTKAATVNQDANTVSVRGQAMIDFLTVLKPPDPPTDPDTGPPADAAERSIDGDVMITGPDGVPTPAHVKGKVKVWGP